MQIVDPRGRVAEEGRGRAPRIGSNAEALQLAFLVNEQSRNQGPDFYGYTLAIEAALRERLQVSTVLRVCKPLLSRPADPAQLEELRHVQGVVNGLAK